MPIADIAVSFDDLVGTLLHTQWHYQQRKAQILNALGEPSWSISRRARHFYQKLGPQILANSILFAGLALAGVWWAYPLLWLVPLLTWMMVITRIRNIAEHAVVHAVRMEVQLGYLNVLRLATSKSASDDRPGAIVNNARRLRSGARIGEDQASAGF